MSNLRAKGLADGTVSSESDSAILASFDYNQKELQVFDEYIKERDQFLKKHLQNLERHISATSGLYKRLNAVSQSINPHSTKLFAQYKTCINVQAFFDDIAKIQETWVSLYNRLVSGEIFLLPQLGGILSTVEFKQKALLALWEKERLAGQHISPVIKNLKKLKAEMVEIEKQIILNLNKNVSNVERESWETSREYYETTQRELAFVERALKGVPVKIKDLTDGIAGLQRNTQKFNEDYNTLVVSLNIPKELLEIDAQTLSKMCEEINEESKESAGSFKVPPPVNPQLSEPSPPTYAQALQPLQRSVSVSPQVIYPQMVNIDAAGVIHVEPQRSVRATVTTVKGSVHGDDSPHSRGSNGSNSSGVAHVNDEKESPSSEHRKQLNGAGGVGSLGVFGAQGKLQQSGAQYVAHPAFNPEVVPLVEQKQPSSYLSNKPNGSGQSGSVLQASAVMYQEKLSKEAIIAKMRELEAAFPPKDDEYKLSKQKRAAYLEKHEIDLFRKQSEISRTLEEEREKIIDQHSAYDRKLSEVYKIFDQPSIYDVFPERFPGLNKKADSCGSKCVVM